MSTVDATFYAQVEPEVSHWTRPGEDEPRVSGAKVVRLTQARPKEPRPGTVLVKLTLRLPVAAFRPLRPEAIVVIPESLTEATPVEVVADDPHAEGGDVQ